MTVRVNKSSFNIREKLSELERPIGLKGSELMRSETVQEARDFISAGRKNLIINGRFDFWQRGTSFTGTEYTADRWQQSLSGGTATVSRQAFTLGQTEVPGNPTYYLQQSCSVGNGNCGIDQKIEDVRTGAGGPVTISFWAKGTNPGIGYWSMQLWQRFGSGGSPSGTVQNNKQLTVTSDWKKYSFTYELASISGKTLGTANNSNLNLIIRQNESDSSTSAWELNIANVQVEFGKNATEFEHRSYGEELALCQRYYEKLSADCGNGGFATLMMASKNSNTLIVGQPIFRVPKRAVGATFSHGGNLRMYNAATGSDITISSVQNSQLGTHGGYIVLVISNNTISNGDGFRVEGSNDTSAFIAFASEL
jgi:hypothetical protein